MIRVVNGLAAAQLVAGGVERRGDLVVDALLPVLRARSAAAGPNIIRRRENERPEWRAVGNLGEGCLCLHQMNGYEQQESREKGSFLHRRNPRVGQANKPIGR